MTSSRRVLRVLIALGVLALTACVCPLWPSDSLTETDPGTVLRVEVGDTVDIATLYWEGVWLEDPPEEQIQAVVSDPAVVALVSTEAKNPISAAPGGLHCFHFVVTLEGASPGITQVAIGVKPHGWHDDPNLFEPPRNETRYYTVAVGQPAEATLTPLPPPTVEAPSGAEVGIPHYQSFALSVGNAMADQVGWVFGRENDDQLAAAVIQTTALAVLYDGEAQTLLDVPGLGGVRDTGDANRPTKLVIYSDGPVVEYSLWHGSTYLQGEVSSAATQEIEIPRSRSFIVTVARPAQGEIGWLFGHENGGKLPVTTLITTADAYTTDSVEQTLLDVPGLGGVSDAGDPTKDGKLVIYSSGPVVEYSLWYGSAYLQGEVSPGATEEIDYPHYQSFVITVARPAAGQIGWLFGRENDDRLVVTTLTTTATANLGDGEVQVLLDLPDVGGVRDTGDPAKSGQLTIFSSDWAAEYSLWYGDTYGQGEVKPVTAPVTPTPPPTPTGWQVYANPQADFTFEYPEGWVVKSEYFPQTTAGEEAEQLTVVLQQAGNEEADDLITINPKDFPCEWGKCVEIDHNLLGTHSDNPGIISIFGRIVASFEVSSPP